ncbi:MAG: DNA cytosine methyltransferase, partial [Treponemataceae bacterium]|nr:DNA cytosine methyltransferase [Treponemataceae bacterium]
MKNTAGSTRTSSAKSKTRTNERAGGKDKKGDESLLFCCRVLTFRVFCYTETNETRRNTLNCIEICAGAGGQALGLSLAGFEHVALIEYESNYCAVLKRNRPDWNVICAD